MTKQANPDTGGLRDRPALRGSLSEPAPGAESGAVGALRPWLVDLIADAVWRWEGTEEFARELADRLANQILAKVVKELR